MGIVPASREKRAILGLLFAREPHVMEDAMEKVVGRAVGCAGPSWAWRLVVACLVAVLMASCVDVESREPDGRTRWTVRPPELRRVVVELQPAEGAGFFVTYRGDLVVREGFTATRVEQDGRLSGTMDLRTISAAPTAVVDAAEGWAPSMVAELALLELMDIPDDVFRQSKILEREAPDDVRGIAHRVTRADGAWVLEPEGESGDLDISSSYFLTFEDTNTPVFHFFNGLVVKLFGGGRYATGYTYPFRYRLECSVVEPFSLLLSQQDEETFVDDVPLIVASFRVVVPVKAEKFLGITSGFDGSWSLLTQDGAGRLVWNHLR